MSLRSAALAAIVTWQFAAFVSPSRAASLQQAPRHDDAGVRTVVDDVLSGPEYRHIVRPKTDEQDTEPSWLERFFEWLFASRTTEVNPHAFSWVALLLRGLVYLIAVSILAVIGAVIVHSIARRTSDRGPRLAVHPSGELSLRSPPGELPSDEYVRRALAFAESQDFRSAIRELLLGSMSWIERAGLIRFRRGLSNRDYLRAVWRRPECRDSMDGIIDTFDRTFFGRRLATAEMFQRCLELYRAGFIGDTTVALAK